MCPSPARGISLLLFAGDNPCPDAHACPSTFTRSTGLWEDTARQGEATSLGLPQPRGAHSKGARPSATGGCTEAAQERALQSIALPRVLVPHDLKFVTFSIIVSSDT